MASETTNVNSTQTAANNTPSNSVENQTSTVATENGISNNAASTAAVGPEEEASKSQVRYLFAIISCAFYWTDAIFFIRYLYIVYISCYVTLDISYVSI